MKVIVGIDVGTNSIGWAILINNGRDVYFIDQAGSRIIPMDAAVLGDFDRGNSTSQTSERTSFRSIRRLLERCLLRRERLHRVLNILGYLPEHYAKQIDFERNPGKFIKGKEPKLAWVPNPETGSNTFLFRESFQEMLADFTRHQPDFIAEGRKVPYDWTLYYLRKKSAQESPDAKDQQGRTCMDTLEFQSKTRLQPTTRRRGRGEKEQVGGISCLESRKSRSHRRQEGERHVV